MKPKKRRMANDDDYNKYLLKTNIMQWFGYKLWKSFGFIEDIFSGFGRNAEDTFLAVAIVLSIISFVFGIYLVFF